MLETLTNLFSSFSRPERTCAIAATALAACTFLPWYSSAAVTTTAFGTGVLGVLVFLATAGCWLGLLIRHKLIEANINAVDLLFGSSMLALVLLLLQLIVGGLHTHVPSTGLVLAIPAAGFLAWSGKSVQQRQALRTSARLSHS